MSQPVLQLVTSHADTEQQDNIGTDPLPPTSQQEAEEQLAILQDRLGQSRAARDRAAAHSPDAPGASDRPQLSSEVRQSAIFNAASVPICAGQCLQLM